MVCNVGESCAVAAAQVQQCLLSTPVAEAQARVELVGERAPVDGLAAGARAGRVTALGQEAADDAVELATIVVALQAQLHKVAHGLPPARRPW